MTQSDETHKGGTDYSLGYILALDAFPPPSTETSDAGAVTGTGTEEEEVLRC